MEPTPEPLNPSSEKTVHQESEDDHQLILDTFSVFFFLLGCLNPVVLLVVLVTVAAGQKKLRGWWVINFGALVGIATTEVFNSVYSYLTPVQEITELMRGNMVKLMHGASADSVDSVVDLVLSHAGTWFCAQIPLGVPVGLIIAGVIILRRSTRGKGNNA
ncbi:hypothetical protein [Rothia mucilaginosa]|uniref:hypothetical protein n=1 Tax=Rothia mucilaginosa TaxID=43675 RepID=UPI0026E9448B|nr:hypothetical protein [Rothia mucilaginosa]